MTQAVLFATPDSDIAPVTEDAAVASQFADLSRCEIGDISEEMFILEARKRGWLVADCRGKGRDFDCILKRPHLARPVVIQVKKANWKAGGKGTARFYSVNCQTNGRVYSATAFDILAVHLKDDDQWVFFTRQELGNRTGTTYTPPKYRQQTNRTGSLDAREPDNWSLLDDVAKSLTTSGPTPANVRPPTVHLITSL